MEDCTNLKKKEKGESMIMYGNKRGFLFSFASVLWSLCIFACRHMVQVVLNEISHPPGPELEFAENRESYSLAAGLALGLITLGVSGGKRSALVPLLRFPFFSLIEKFSVVSLAGWVG